MSRRLSSKSLHARRRRSRRITGTAVIPASAGRKQAFVAHQDTSISMVFPTKSTSVEQAEAEFTDDADLLFSRRDADLNTEIITGAKS